jgi:hypothetical protein
VIDKFDRLELSPGNGMPRTPLPEISPASATGFETEFLKPGGFSWLVQKRNSQSGGIRISRFD